MSSFASDSLLSEYRGHISEIRRYLKASLGDLNIREAEDFDRDGIVFLTDKKSPTRFRMFISHEFLSDFPETRATSLLRSWRVAEKARTLLPGMTLFVTTTGTFEQAASF